MTELVRIIDILSISSFVFFSNSLNFALLLKIVSLISSSDFPKDSTFSLIVLSVIIKFDNSDIFFSNVLIFKSYLINLSFRSSSAFLYFSSNVFCTALKSFKISSLKNNKSIFLLSIDEPGTDDSFLFSVIYYYF